MIKLLIKKIYKPIIFYMLKKILKNFYHSIFQVK